MNYIIVPTSNSDYQSWQCRLLNWSRKKTKQSGKLIFLRCNDEMGTHHQLDTYNDPDVEVIDLPDYALDWENQEEYAHRGEKFWWGAIPNKYRSIKWLCENYPFRDEDVLFFLDPDMVFTEKVNLIPAKNEIIAQRFIHYYPLEKWKVHEHEQPGDGVMYPFIIRADDLKIIISDYIVASENIRRETKRWEAEMWGLDYAVKKHNLHIRYEENLGHCTAWHVPGDTHSSSIIHFPNEIVNAEKERIWFKQDYTFQQNMTILAHSATNTIEKKLLLEVAQERTDYLYYLKWNFQDIFTQYTGELGYVIFRPWPGGFNNIRMSLELAVCLAFLTNKTLVLPLKYNMYLLHDEFGMEDFFDSEDLGIRTINFYDFCTLKQINSTYDDIRSISKVVNDAPENVLNFEKIFPCKNFTKGRNIIKYHFNDECIFFDGNLLGNFYQTIHTHQNTELKKLIARHVHYKPEILDYGWKCITWLQDQGYYAIHVRRNDFQFKHLFISIEQIYENIKDVIPLGSKLYIATDEADKQFFNFLRQYYTLIFYEDIASHVELAHVHPNYIPIIEQLICSRAIKFIGNDYSTLSSYVFRMRGYMNDTMDDKFYVNTEKFSIDRQGNFFECTSFIGNWAREFKDVWDFTEKKIFVSIASYCDAQLIPTINNLFNTAGNKDRLVVGIHIQDDEHRYHELLKYNFSNVKIIFTPKEQSRGVVWAREKIKNELFSDEDYFLQIDAHTRFKTNWDAILINQISNVPTNVVFSTYPNEFSLNDDAQTYIEKIPTNAPLKIKKFFSDDLQDNRLIPQNTNALEDYAVVDSYWIAGGFIFAPKQWVKDVHISGDILSKGEEDIQLYLSYLNGWDIKVPSEAVVWHNYTAFSPDGIRYREVFTNTPNITDDSIKVINDILFEKNYPRSIQQLEDYLGIKLRNPKLHKKTIFVALTSFIDDDLRNTILNCVQQAKDPENLSFGLILQYNNAPDTNERCVDDLITKYNIRVKKFWFEDSLGGCWARNHVADLLNDETYVLQIDCHTRFIKHWDSILIEELHSIKRKAVISYLSPSFYRNKELGVDYFFQHIENPYIINVPKITSITSDYWPTFVGYTNERHTNNQNREVSILYAGFVFAPASWFHDVKNDPDHYYTGEEFALSIRTYTHGYNIYQPSKVVSWHKSDPTHLHHFKALPTGDELHAKAMTRLKMLINEEDLGQYGLGTQRTLQEYENFARIHIKENIVYE